MTVSTETLEAYETLKRHHADAQNFITDLKLTIANQRAQLQTLNTVLAKRKFASRKMKAALDTYRRNDPELKAMAEQNKQELHRAMREQQTRMSKAVQDGPQPQPTFQ